MYAYSASTAWIATYTAGTMQISYMSGVWISTWCSSGALLGAGSETYSENAWIATYMASTLKVSYMIVCSPYAAPALRLVPRVAVLLVPAVHDAWHLRPAHSGGEGSLQRSVAHEARLAHAAAVVHDVAGQHRHPHPLHVLLPLSAPHS
mmetsp:Transcript_33709/g.101492  ORF Transcript_33709/g.101492 Transcript_33709/m.101492 type:complete len:149 (-) Transcript_33709:184-630(-)